MGGVETQPRGGENCPGARGLRAFRPIIRLTASPVSRLLLPIAGVVFQTSG